MKIKVSGFPDVVGEHEIRRIFTDLGTVVNVQKELRKNTAYVIMKYDYQGKKAVQSLNGTKIWGRSIKVEEQI